MRLYQVFILFVLLGLVPLIVGWPWVKSSNISVFAVFPLGFFIELSLFQMLEFPFAVFDFSLRALTAAFLCSLFFLCFFSLRYIHRRLPAGVKSELGSIWNCGIIQLRSLTPFEWIYFSIFICLLAFQVYQSMKADFTIFSYDDNWYVVWASDAIYSDRLFRIAYASGVAHPFTLYRALQSSLIFPATLSLLTGVSVVVIEHTILQVFYLLLAWSVYVYLAKILFNSPENTLVFLIFLALVYIFGFYSHYSTTFRLLGPNYQGKAVLAVSMTPLVFALMVEKLDKKYDRGFCFLLILLSMAATACTLIGIVTIVANVALPVVLNLFGKNRRWKHLLYCVGATIMPAIYGIVFLLNWFWM